MPFNSVTVPLAIVLGAIPGALARYYLTEWAKTKWGTQFPYGTLMINITGCFAIGFFVTLSQGIFPHNLELDLMTKTGFLGSYTTFSTYGYDAFTLDKFGQVKSAFFYGVGSVVLGVLGVYIGDFWAKSFL